MKQTTLEEIPNEIIDQIILLLPKKKLPTIARVSKRFYGITKPTIFKKIQFDRLEMRDRFFDALGNQFHQLKSPSSPKPLLRRRASLRSSNSSKLIQSLDFGLRPRNMAPNEPPLPCSKPISPTRMLVDSPIGTIPIPTEQGPSSQGPRLQRKLQSVEDEIVYGTWEHRFIARYIPLVITLPHLKELIICGCHVSASDFITMMQQLTQLQRLDISYSTLKSDGVSCISRYCRVNLETLNMSGIFKFARNRSRVLLDIVLQCRGLLQVIVKDCPEIYPETLDDAKGLNQKITFVTE
jgi:hypothetical protein